MITVETQTVVWKPDYEPFGKTTIPTELITNNLRFPGQYFDQETNLHYNIMRDYDPLTGRYIESDPIGLKGGMNTISYVENNPIRYKDTLGLIVEKANSPPRSNTGATLVCRKGKLDVELLVYKPCIEDCLIKHEENHIQWVNLRARGICDGEIFSYLRWLPGKASTYEPFGYQAELRCLEGDNSLMCFSTDCINERNNRIMFIKNERLDLRARD